MPVFGAPSGAMGSTAVRRDGDASSWDKEPGGWTNGERTETQTLQSVTAHMTDEYHGPIRDEDLVERKKLPYELEMEARGHKITYPAVKPKQKLSPDEANSFADLLGKVLTWEPSERTSAEDLIGHPWFSTDFPDVPTAEDAPALFQS